MNPDTQIMPKKENLLKEILKFAILAVIIIVPLRTWVADPFIVSGLSMYPTFNNNEYLIVDQLTYDFRKPARGDVIIFKYPLNPTEYFIKRVIGLPGETVSSKAGVISITKNTATSTETFTLSEPYVAPEHRMYDTWTKTLGPTEYWAMGDNRNQSSDSRTWGALDQKFLVGRPIVRALPPAFLPGKVSLPNN